MVASRKTNKKAKRQRIHKRLLVSGADERSFRNGFGRQRKTVFLHPPSPTENPAKNQQAGSSHRYTNPHDSSWTSGSQVDSGLGRVAYTSRNSGQGANTHLPSGYFPFQPGHIAPALSATATFGQTFPAYPPSPSLYNSCGVDSVSPPEIHFGAAGFYEATTQEYPQVQPPWCAWNQAGSQSVWLDIGTTGYGQCMSAQQNGPVEDQFSAHYLCNTQPSRQQHLVLQSPYMYDPHHADPSAVDDGPWSPPLGIELPRNSAQ